MSNRINAIKDLQNLGWNIGLRFDPFIWYGNAKEMSLFFKKIFDSLNRERVHSVTIGNFRMSNIFLKKIVKIKPTDSYILKKQINRILPNSLNDETTFCINNIKEEISKFIEKSKNFY